jgi:hypothetical protein
MIDLGVAFTHTHKDYCQTSKAKLDISIFYLIIFQIKEFE